MTCNDRKRVVDRAPMFAPTHLLGTQTLPERIGPNLVSMESIAQAIAGLIPGGLTIKDYGTFANLPSSAEEGTLAYADKKTYRKTATGWELYLDFIPGSQTPFAVASSVDGTPNAIIAEPNLPVSASGKQLVQIWTIAENTTSPVTIKFPTTDVLTIKTANGNDVQPEGMQPGPKLGFVQGSNFILLSDVAPESLMQATEAAMAAAQEARDAALSAVPSAFPPTRTILADLADTIINARLTEQGREGDFRQVNSGDYAALAAADTVGGDIVAKPGNPNLAYLRQRKNGDLIKTSEFGHDLHVALAVARERRVLLGPTERVDVLINQAGTMAVNSALQAADGVNFFSDKSLVLDISGVTVGKLVNAATGIVDANGRVFLDARPVRGASRAAHYTALPAFQPIAVGDMAVTFNSAHGLKLNQLFVLNDSADGSWFAERPEYKLSMRRRVVGIDGNKVWIDRPARDVFIASATCKAYKQVSMRGRFGGFTVDFGANTVPASQGVHLYGLDDGSEVADIVVSNARNSGIILAQSFNVRPQRMRGGTIPGTGVTSIYPIQIQNCTDVRIRDSEGCGDWHTLAMTGAGGTDVGQVINEDCWFENCKSYNTGNTTVPAIEMHGNSDRCGFLNCEAAGAVMGGRDASIIGGSLDNAPSTVAGQAKLVFIGEQHSGRFLISGTRMRSIKNTGTDSTSGAIYCYTGANQKSEIFVDMVGVVMDLPLEQRPILIGNGINGNAKVSFSFDGAINAPNASALAVITNGNNAATSSYFRIERAAGFADGKPWAVSLANGTGGHMQFSDWKFPIQKVVLQSAGVAVASELLPAAGTGTWPHPYPVSYTPTAWAALQDSLLGVKAHAEAIIGSAAWTDYRVRLSNGDATNLTAASTKVAIFSN